MNVTPTAVPAPADAAASGPAATVRMLAGNLAAVPVGELLKAVVTRVAGGEATVNVNGQPLTVRPPGGLQAGGEFVVRLPGGKQTGTLEILGRAPPQLPAPATPTTNLPLPATANRANPAAAPATSTPTPTVSASASAAVLVPPAATAPSSPAPAGRAASPAPLAVADVVSAGPDGKLVVRIDGKQVPATSAEPLAAGGRYLVRVEPTPAGLVLRPPPADAPENPTAVATAVVRGSRPADIGATVKPLLAEIATPAPAVKLAAAEVRDAVRSFLPDTPRPPNATELRALVENGGLHFEAKLGRAADDAGPEVAAKSASPATVETAGKPATPPVRPAADAAPPADLKGGLLQLLHAAQSAGEAATAYPAARAVLDGIESQQAVNALAQQAGTPYFLQVPFPDGDTWKTANLSLEPDRHAADADPEAARGFRVMMHVPLADLGDTWIDAGVAGGTFRAVLYLDSATARDRVRAELGGLRDELQAGGFGEVLLDVRPGSEVPARHRAQAAAVLAGRPAAVHVLDARA